MPNFAGLWCPNYLTQGYSWGIIGKIISVAFIWYLVVLCVTDSLVTIASWKSGLILSTLKMLISVLSNKAVLGSDYVNFLQGWFPVQAVLLSHQGLRNFSVHSIGQCKEPVSRGALLDTRFYCYWNHKFRALSICRGPQKPTLESKF